MKTRRHLLMRVIYLFMTFVLYFILPENLLADVSASISGRITDSATGDVLPGANVIIVGTSLGAASDQNGEFRISKVPPGSYTLRVTFMGYERKDVPVLLETNETLKLDIELTFTTIAGEEVVITAQREGQIAAINQQLTADAIKNVVSAERIQELPDANAAESVARLPGISLIRSGGEGRNVVIRGLAPKFNKITINGVSIPSTNTTSRSNDLSMISSENLAGIEAFKALTPDMDGDAIGGVVNMQLAKAREKPDRYLRIYGAYNAQEKDLRQYKASFNWSQRILKNKLGIQASLNSEFRNRSSDDLSASYTLSQPRPDGTVPLRLTNATVGDTEEYRDRNGASLILDYDLGNWSMMLSNFFSQTKRNILDRETRFEAGNEDTKSRIKNPERNADLYTAILNGEGAISFVDVDWILSYSSTNSNLLNSTRMDFIQFESSVPLVDYETVHPADLLQNIVPDSSSNAYISEHEENSVKEKAYVAALNFELPYRLGQNLSGALKWGAKYRVNDRFKDSRTGDWRMYQELTQIPMSDYFDPDYDPGKFLDGRSSLGIVLDPSKTNAFYNEYRSNFQISEFLRDQYEVTDGIFGSYLMTKLNIGQFITFIPGVRYEQFNGNYLGYYKFDEGHGSGKKEPRESKIIYEDWLPMVHLKIKPLNWFDVRLAVTKTLVRPGFTDMLPNFYSSFQNTDVSQGNPDLEPTRSWNYDAYASFHSPILGLFTFGYFYKEIEGAVVDVKQYIESAEKATSLGLPVNFYDDLTYVGRMLSRPENMPASTVKGFELDFQTNLGFLPGYLKGLVANVNYTRLWSETPYPYFKIETIIDPTVFPPVRREYINGTRLESLAGQADHLINMSIGYDIGGFSARISMNYQGESLSSAGGQKENDSWKEDFTRWDFSVRQKLNAKVSLFLNGSNLNGQYDGSYRALDPRPTALHYYGSMYDFGIQYRF